MGSCYSRIDREEMVTHCKARKRYTKQFVKARQVFAASHALYLRSLRSTGAALLQFANAEATRHHAPPPLTPRPSQPTPPSPPMSPHSSNTWTSSSFTASPAPPSPPPPSAPPPPPQSSGWDFWYPFVPQSRTATEEDWEATTAASEVGGPAAPSGPVAPPPPSSGDSGFSKGGSSSEMSLVVSRNGGKDLVGVIRDLDEYFLRAADSGKELSLLLEVPAAPVFPSQTKGGRVYDNVCNLSPSIWTLGCSSQRFSSNIVQFGDRKIGGNLDGRGSHCSTSERLFAWEKKLYQEVKNAGLIKMEHEKRVEQLRKLELKRAEYIRIEKTKKEVEKLESQMTVASKAIETTSSEITQLREMELYPQLLDIVKGLMCMWRSMYECHQVQSHIVQQLKYLNNTIPSMEPTTEIHRQSTLQLEHEVQQWLLSFCSLVASQRNYIHSLTGWLHLSLFQFNHHNNNSPPSSSSSNSRRIRIYSLCEEWTQAIDRIPDRVASEGIKSLLTVVHAIVVQQEEEHQQKKKSELVFKKLERKNNELRSLQSKMLEAASVSERTKNATVAEKRAKVTTLRARAEEEKTKLDKSVSETRTTTLNNLQMGLPHVFQALLGFSSVCMKAFESLYNQAKDNMECHDDGVKRLLPS